jgi:hypothetical protein
MINFSETEGKKPTRKQLNEILNILSMIMIEEPKAISVLIDNGYKVETEWFIRYTNSQKKTDVQAHHSTKSKEQLEETEELPSKEESES